MHRHRWLSVISRSSAVAIAVAAGSAAFGQAAPPNESLPTVLRSDHPTRIVTIDVPDQQRLHWLLDTIGVNPLACRPGVGEQRYHASVEQLAQIERSGLEYVVNVDNAEAMFKAERERIEASNADRGANWFDDYKTYAQINAKIDELVALRPDLVTKITVGTTHEGRTIFGMRISGSATTKPGVLFNGCQHAREWISPMTNMFIANQLVTKYDTESAVQQAVDSIEFFIVPVVNPDGYEYSWNTYRLWRKNRRNNGGGDFGVDLNRNWDIDWNGGESTSTSPSSDVYVGPAPFSEPETSALRDFYLARPNIVAHIDFHSYSQIILEAWGYTPNPPANFDAIHALGADMHDAALAVNGYEYPHGGGGELIYLASGTCADWTHSQQCSFGYTIELRPDCCTFELPAVEIIPTGQEMFAAALAMADWAAAPLDVSYPAGGIDVITPDQPTTFTVQIQSQQGGDITPTSAKLFTATSARGSFSETTLTSLGGDMFEGTLPAVACGESISYYIEAETTCGGTVTAPGNAPDELFVATALQQTFAIDDDFESDLGWTTESAGASSGQWQRGVPVNDPGWAYDPAADADGSGQCWLTQNETGNTDVDGGAVRLISPLLDMTGAAANGDWQVRYDYYLYLNNTSSTDALYVEVSSNDTAGPWIEIARHDQHGGVSWHEHSFSGDDLVAAGATLSSTMRFRFTATDDSPASIVEAGVDGFAISRTGCEQPGLPADIAEPFGVVDLFDLLLLLDNWNTPNAGADIAPPTDVVDLFDLLEMLDNWG